MRINDSWKFKDEVTGLSMEIIIGEKLNRLRIRKEDEKLNRDFWFTKNGDFDGTGAFFSEEETDGEEKV